MKTVENGVLGSCCCNQLFRVVEPHFTSEHKKILHIYNFRNVFIKTLGHNLLKAAIRARLKDDKNELYGTFV